LKIRKENGFKIQIPQELLILLDIIILLSFNIRTTIYQMQIQQNKDKETSEIKIINVDQNENKAPDINSLFSNFVDVIKNNLLIYLLDLYDYSFSLSFSFVLCYIYIRGSFYIPVLHILPLIPLSLKDMFFI
jgi:hypothetical protein